MTFILANSIPNYVFIVLALLAGIIMLLIILRRRSQPEPIHIPPWEGRTSHLPPITSKPTQRKPFTYHGKVKIAPLPKIEAHFAR
ncbi:hypothetical protein N7523_009391 [Penicillium sp. IBT 18751x]|nr:hypothetical protein N7523_009391 [Penicillium sp. IBT 18751x]